MTPSSRFPMRFPRRFPSVPVVVPDSSSERFPVAVPTSPPLPPIGGRGEVGPAGPAGAVPDPRWEPGTAAGTTRCVANDRIG